MIKKPNVIYCKKCVYPSSSAVPLEFNDDGVASCSESGEMYELKESNVIKLG